MAHKRKLIEEFDSVSSAASSESATIHGVIAEVGDMIPGKRAKFFEARLTDDDKHMRVVGFQREQQIKLARYRDDSKPVALTNCEVKKARESEELELILKSSSRVGSSPKKFEVGEITIVGSSELSLDELDGKMSFAKVSLNAKAIGVSDPVTVSGGLRKQDVTISDSKSSARMTLWEKDIGRMVMGNSYRLTNIIVRSYQQVKYLSMPKEGATIVQIEDIGKVADADTAENYITITTAEVVGVQRLDMYSACLACKAKVSPTSEILGSCSKCDMVQRIDRCKKQLSVKLIIADGAEYITLNAFGSNVMDRLNKK